jgi:hypothetical protein
LQAFPDLSGETGARRVSKLSVVTHSHGVHNEKAAKQ